MEAGPAAREDASLERFDPGEDAGKLIDSEHRGRYWWAAQAVAGRDVLDAGCGVGYGLEVLATAGAASVTGVDIDEGAVERARERRVAGEILTGDLRKLPFEDESFDVVVCFETIHHVADGERALGELHRVLRPGGLLLISSPSPDVYQRGNEHHVHEYRPGGARRGDRGALRERAPLPPASLAGVDDRARAQRR
jgi:2-polyprenyl-3-methyl-5-hydroxy-6-metoxy-1,4-benzoquinol methylase